VRFLLVFVLMVLSLYASRDGGPYIGGGYGFGNFDDNGYYDIKDKISNGYKVYAGAYINYNLSVEIEHITKLEYTTKDNQILSPNFIDINTQVHYQFFLRKIDTFLKFGVGEINDKTKGFTFVYGGGVAWWINEKYLLKVGYDRFDFGFDGNNDNSADIKFKLDYVYTSIEVQF